MPRGTRQDIEHEKMRALGRRRIFKVAAFVLLIALAAFSITDHLGWFAYPSDDWSLDGDQFIVERIPSGDTLQLKDCGEVKLLGVGWDRRGEQFLSQFVGQRLTLHFAPSLTRDKQHRLIAYLYLNGACLNQLLIQSGQAYADASTNHPLLATFRIAEAEARRKRLGRWK